MKTSTISGLLTLVIVLSASGCGNGTSDSVTSDRDECNITPTTAYVFDLPAHFPQFAVSNNNPTTEQGVALGKRLYYDTMLSQGGPMQGNACASCHVQNSAFSKNSTGTAVLPHTNLNWSSFFLWNGKVSGGLEEIMDFEIREFFQANVALFKADPTYRRMSCEAFGTSIISETQMANAMAQWMRTLLSYRSKYDRFVANLEDLTDLEHRGFIVFSTDIGDCFKCHALPLTTDLAFHNNGLEFMPTGVNLGRYNVTSDPADKGWFKTPSLRNIALTAPYMHDGRFQTLEEVIEHYNSGVHWSDTLDPVMQRADKKYGLGLSPINKEALVAFLNTFTDTSVTTNPEFSDPFK